MGTWGRWAWCPGAVNLPDSLSWAPGQPDNAQPDENCLHLQVTKNASGILLSDRNCSHKFVMACQGADVMITPDCYMPICPMECNLFVHGQWNAGCGKDYLFSAATLDWFGAWKYCCSVGMKLASIEALEELSCLTKMVAKYPKAFYPDQCGRDFWTSGTNRGCPGAHFWCSENEKLNKEEIANWKNGKMPSESADQCIFINLSNSTLSKTYLGADTCTKQKPFLCEALQPGTNSIQIARTCKEIWNVTENEVNKIIMNATGNVVNQRRNIKCYLRCCGKKGNVIKTGSLVTDNILRNLEDLTADDPQAMQDGFGNFDSCTSIQSTDECHTMAQMFQCGKKNDPDLTLGLVTAIKGDATVSVTAAGGIKTGERVCPVYPKCVPNVILQI
ncbi:macrophage mannose receptor 1-like [Cloeon dipterum]|uniref:macrophage mannose receptor 1-like n=1 Tax=Cloeon dipterum TaxID=197152 RepID=UPI003220528C